jgi:beta-glucosidase
MLLPEISTLSLPAQIAQMIVVRTSGYLFDHQIRYPVWEPPTATLYHWLAEVGVGGVIVLGASAGELALRIQQLQSWAKMPLLVCADVEEGVGQRFPGATWFPPPMALSAVFQTHPEQAEHYAEQMGMITAQESLAIGLNWLLAPTVDVNNNPSNPVINVRAFGEAPDAVSRLTTAFIRGTQRYPILTTAKHFPGHGDTAIDSHLALPTLLHSRERLQTLELLPFQTAIAAQVDAVMTAHLHIPALDPDLPATLSPAILNGLLRQDLGFDGLIVTDALIMGAIANRYGANEAAVLAAEAGADILLMPANPIEAIEAVCRAVEAGRISPAQIEASVERIWAVKQKACAPALDHGSSDHAWETVTPTVQPQILTSELSTPTAIALIDTILQHSQTVYVPAVSHLASPASHCRNLIVVDDALESKIIANHHPSIATPARKGYTLQLIDRNTPAIDLSTDAQDWQPTLLQLFIRSNPFRDASGIIELAQSWLQMLIQSEQLQALAIYGSPYVLDVFLPHLPPHVPYVFTYGQMPAAQAIALNCLFETPNPPA